MGQKVNPNGFRVGVIRDWNTRWYASKKEFSDFLIEDKKIRDHIKEVHYAAGIARIDIMRAAGKVTVSIYTAVPHADRQRRRGRRRDKGRRKRADR